jgi:hypothetical protein
MIFDVSHRRASDSPSDLFGLRDDHTDFIMESFRQNSEAPENYHGKKGIFAPVRGRPAPQPRSTTWIIILSYFKFTAARRRIALLRRDLRHSDQIRKRQAPFVR